ncbi:hypothetical protein CY34DRAFT_263893 [Suillus luteus UH-Slu-Lm8-n1]|uniref:Secreted protein n=1 Tax=Suillus luteus UH-Slu-Lm8-n1 TaxID=930992 RepID=A0A0D0BNA9_9AGAM|nr:hypothetical protein CY34DRAFT_263893 [Suillus luteus UH-Slu-Lm8-n1]
MGEALIHFLMLILVLPTYPRGSRSIAPAHMVQQCILNLVCTGHRSRCKLNYLRNDSCTSIERTLPQWNQAL